jgi:hypothetical protein
MKRFFTLILLGAACCASNSLAKTKNDNKTALLRRPALRSDINFMNALAASDGTAAAQLLDDDFTWTDTSGKILAKADYLQSMGDSAMAGAADPVEHNYGKVSIITSSKGRTQLARIWVKRKAGWRLLTYDETTLTEQEKPLTSSGIEECENPCKTLPYSPKNDAERGIITSWQALETAVTHHDSAGWAPHIADEFVLVNANNDHPLSKADRMAILDKQKVSGTGAAPVPLISAKMFDFGDTVVMTARHQRGDAKPIHVTRVWIMRDGQWMMAFSQQTTIQ